MLNKVKVKILTTKTKNIIMKKNIDIFILKKVDFYNIKS